MSTLVRQTFDARGTRDAPLLLVRRMYAAFCQGLFYAAPVGSYHWEPELGATEVVITDENPIQLNVVGKRPAISFTRGPVQFFGLGLDDMARLDMSTGAKTKTMMLPGNMNINCCSRNDIESEYLAGVVAEQLWLNRELLMRAGFFEIGRNFVIGAPSPAGSIVAGDGADEWYATTITSPFHISRTAQFSPLNTQIVQNMQFSLSTRGFQVPPPYVQPSVDFPPGASTVQQTVENGEVVPQVPHPLDPTKMVTVRYVGPPGARPRTVGGQTIPVREPTVEGLAKPSLTFKV